MQYHDAGRPSRAMVMGIGEIGARLKLSRLAQGLSVADLCQLTGLKPSTYSHWERGRARPPVDKAKALHRLGYTLDWIYDGDRSGLAAELATAIAHQATENLLAKVMQHRFLYPEMKVEYMQAALARRMKAILSEQDDPPKAMRDLEDAARVAGLLTCGAQLGCQTPEELSRSLWLENPIARVWLEVRVGCIRRPETIRDMAGLLAVLRA